ncbi:MAG TPA: DoxX family protein [Terriglobales bacterium]|nr:DoxX family protein [Terriglobales bacterium]
MEKQSYALNIGPWVLRLAVAFIFVSSGLEKFGIGPGQEWIRIFAKIGLGNWFRYFTGALEIAGGVLLMIPFTAKGGAGLLLLCMAGAIVCHVFILGDPFSSIINLGLIVAIVAAARQRRSKDEKMTTLELR